MPFYHGIRWPERPESFTLEERKRTAAKLIDLRGQLEAQVPVKTANETLLLATWNIREFDTKKFGPRLEEALYYIAEIIAAFDLVALQEVNEDLSALEKVMRILGRDWDFIATDVTEGKPGNRERIAFVYDKCKVSFQNIAGEVVLAKEDQLLKEQQFARTPFLVAFQAGWAKLMLCSVHIYYGSDSATDIARRKAEIEELVEFFAKRAKSESRSTSQTKSSNYVLLGDFNIKSHQDETMKALESNGFYVPDQLHRPTNIDGTKPYDQIAFRERRDKLEFADKPNSAGVFNYYKSVFKDDELALYADYMRENKKDFDTKTDAEQKKYYQKTWRTYEMSDHFPLWVELKIDFSNEYLARRLEELNKEGG